MNRFALCLALGLGASAYAQLEADKTLEQLTVADGLEISLFAAEPDLRNPTSMDIDAQGRVWVLEAANYRLFNQEIVDEKGDRIRILEDTDGDGNADKATTFYQDPSLQAPMSIAVLGERVYVTQSPDIFYLEDTDNDGKADKKTVVLTGFKGVDHDHAIHGIQFRADGYLYVSNGDKGLDVTDGAGTRIHAGPDAPYQAATVLRTDLEGHTLEVLASNMRNPVEPTMDSFGRVFISDNDDDGNEQTRINYVMEGGQYGYWNLGTNGRRQGNRRLDDVHWNTDQPDTVPTMLKTGFGSPTGMMAYESDYLPERFNRTLIHCDAGPGEVRAYRPVADGAGYRAEVEVLVSSPNDSWFRPSDVVVAPDGSLFITDWYDAGVGGHRMVDARLGRVYRVTRKGDSDEYSPALLNLTTSEGVRAAFTSPNQARHYLAFQTLKTMEGADEFLQDLYENGDAVAQARAFWMLAQMGKTQEAAIKIAAADERPEFREMAVRAVARFAPGLDHVLTLLENDPDPRVRRQLLVELGYPARSGQPGHGGLSSKGLERVAKLQAQYDGEDRFYLNALGIAASGHEAELLSKLDSTWDKQKADVTFQYHPETALPEAIQAAETSSLDREVRVMAMRAIDAMGTREAGAWLVDAAFSEDAVLQETALLLLGRSGGNIWRREMSRNDFDAKIAKALETNPDNVGVLNFVRASNRVGATSAIVESLTSRAKTDEAKLAHLNTLESIIGNTPREEHDRYVVALSPFLSDANEDVQTRTAAALTRLKGADARNALLDFISNGELSRSARVRAIQGLDDNVQGAKKLLDLAEDEALPEDILYFLSETLHGSQFEDIRERVALLLPRESTSGGQTLPPLRDLVARPGDPVAGKRIFADEERTTCTKCHAVGDLGADVGPNLGKIGEKLSRQSLFESILDPNAAISHEYKAWNIDTKDGDFYTGYIRSEDNGIVQLVDSNGIIRRIPLSNIDAREESPLSVMPSGLAAALTVEELVDMVAYLETLK